MFGRTRDLVADLQDELESATQRVRELTAVGPDALNRRPTDDAWSAAECIDHLNGTARLYLPVLDEAIAGAREAGLTGDRGDGRTVLGRLVAWMMEPPPRFRTRTFPRLEPARDRDPDALVREFADLHGRLAAQLRSASDLDRRRIKVRSLLDSRLKLSLDDWYAFIAAHARRHIWQAERAIPEPDSE